MSKLNYKLVKKLSSGGQGCVYIATSEGKKYALKTVLFDDIHTTKLGKTLVPFKIIVIREMSCVTNLEHPNIIRYIDFYVSQTPEDEIPMLNIVMDLYEEGDFERYLLKNKDINYDDFIDYAIQISSAMSYLHEKKIIHRDLKPRNILVKTDKSQVFLVVCDFGLSVKDGESKNNTMVGTESYVAPEVIQKKPQSDKVDLFSFGAILFKMATGKEKCFYLEVMSNEKAHLEIYETIRDKYGDNVAELVVKLLSKNPDSRPTSEDCLRMLKLMKQHKSIKKGQLFKQKTDIRTVSVLGGGSLGSKVAGELARCGFTIHVVDQTEEQLKRVKESIITSYSDFCQDGMMKYSQMDACLNRIHLHTDLSQSVKSSELIIEALPENLELKQQYFSMVEDIIDEDVILASCTLSLDLEEVFSTLKVKSRSLGMRLLLPVYFLSMVEYNKTSHTDPLTVLRTIDFIHKMSKEAYERISERNESTYVYNVPLLTRSQGMSTCKKCKVNRPNACMIPCGHVGYCMKCVESTVGDVCPYCSSKMDSIIELKFY
eukprot:gene5293-8911_t